MKTFDNLMHIEPEHFDRMERRAKYGKGGIFVDDEKDPDKSIINDFCGKYALNDPDIWKFYVFYKYHFIVLENHEETRKRFKGYSDDLEQMRGFIQYLECGYQKPGKRINVNLKSLSLNTNILKPVRLSNPVLLDAFVKFMKENLVKKPFEIPGRSDTYIKEFATGLKLLFEYLYQIVEDKEQRYRMIIEFITLIDPKFETYTTKWLSIKFS